MNNLTEEFGWTLLTCKYDYENWESENFQYTSFPPSFYPCWATETIDGSGWPSPEYLYAHQLSTMLFHLQG
jgi:hypothetical protein